MIKKLIKYERIKDIVNLKESETILSLLISIGLCVFLNCIQLYDKFDKYVEVLYNNINAFIGGYVALIGLALSGMAIMMSLFNKKELSLIEKCNEKGIIEKVMSSYAFFAFISVINIIILFILSFAISSNLRLLPSLLFWFLTLVIIYLLLFDLFYAVALIFNCISLFSIEKIYSVCTENEDLFSLANDIRIDFLMGILVKNANLSREDVLNGLQEETESLPDDLQKKLKEYFENHYPE